MAVLIVGGSLCGITFALACAKHGIPTRVLERAPKVLRNGGCLAVDRSRLFEVVGVAGDSSSASSFPRSDGVRRAVPWHSLQNWLLQLATEKSEIVIESGVTIEVVRNDDTVATAVTSTGHSFTAPLIVGADGQCSTVRRAVDPQRPQASYAGYILWRGLIPETSLPATTDRSLLGEAVSLVTRNGHRLVAFTVASDVRPSETGSRLLSCVWYDPGRLGLLLKLGCVDSEGNVLRSPRPDEIPSHLIDELCSFAERRWPEPWRTVITRTIAANRLFAHTAAEYYPRRLHAGRITLIGDAAHVVSPVTERGFATGIEDISVLSALLANTQVHDYVEALERFERARLPAAQLLVATSKAWSKKFITDPVRASSETNGGLYPIPASRRTRG